MRALALLLILLPSFAVAQFAPVTTFTLDNGMEAVVIEDHRAPVVTHMVWYRAGAADEAPGKSGVAHFLEHLMFKGTDQLAPGEFSAIISANGGSDNAFTAHDYTGYFQRIIADRLDMVMQMEADRMTDLVFSDKDMITELQVVLEERNQRTENSPGALFSEQRNAALYLNHPYGRPVIGWKHEVSALTREDALDWYRTHYAPDNAVLVVAGDVDPAEVRRLAEKYYGPIPSSGVDRTRHRASEPPHRSPRRLVYEDPRVRQPYVVRTYLATERNSGAQEEAAALTILAELLGGSGITSVIGRELQLNQKIAISSGAFYDGLALDRRSFGLFVIPAPDVSLEEAEAALDAVLDQFLKDGPDADHLARIKKQIRAAEIFSLDDQAYLARRYGSALTQGLTVADVQAWTGILQAVDDAAIMAAARNVFDLNHSVTGYLKGVDFRAEASQ